MTIDIREIFGIQNRFRGYMDGIRVVMLIDRGVMNSNKGSRRWINKIITTNESEWINAVTRLGDLQDFLGNPDIRMYSCLNSRNLDKAVKEFQHRQLDVLPDMKLRFYAHINNTFASCLMKPQNKATKLFMLDIDSKDTKEVDDFVAERGIVIRKVFPSKTGWHYVVEPFNATWADGQKTFTLLKDGLLLIRYLDHGQDKTVEP